MEGAERLPDRIDADTLRKYFALTKPDLSEVERCREALNKLGFAIQLCTLRLQGYFLSDTRNLASEVIETPMTSLAQRSRTLRCGAAFRPF